MRKFHYCNFKWGHTGLLNSLFRCFHYLKDFKDVFSNLEKIIDAAIILNPALGRLLQFHASQLVQGWCSLAFSFFLSFKQLPTVITANTVG